MKRLVRLLLKIPGTIIILPVWLLLLLSAYVMKFVDWVYEANKLEKEVTASLIQDYKNSIKSWFTTL